MRILVDTHILIWVLEGNSALPSYQKLLLADITNEKMVSRISFMEMAIKINIGKLSNFKVSLTTFIEQVERDGFKILPVNNFHITTYTSLPLISNHRDLFDRFIISTAIAENRSIMTEDEKFKACNHQVKLV